MELVTCRIKERGQLQRVILHLGKGCRIQFLAQFVQILPVSRIFLFFFRGESVQADILQQTCTCRIVECIDRTLLLGNFTPNRIIDLRRIAIDRQSVLEEFLFIFQYVFRYLAQVKIQVSTCGLAVIDKRVEHPEFDIFDICRLEVALVYLAHHTSETLFRVLQCPVRIDVIGIQVIRAAFLRIVSHVQNRQRIAFTHALLPLREQLSRLDSTDIMVGQVFCRDILRTQRGILAREQSVDRVPGKQSAAFPVIDIIGQSGFREELGRTVVIRHAGQLPGIRVGEVEIALCRLEVIQIRVSARVLVFVMAGDQMRELRIEGYLARFAQVQQRQLVEHVRKPLAFALIGHIDTPKRILDRFVAHRRFGGQRHFGHVHDGGAYHQVRIELVVQVQSHHGLALHIIGRLVFQRDADRRTCGNNTFVQDRHHAGSIVDGIIHILGQYRSAGRYLDRTPRHVGSAQLYLGSRRGFVFPFQFELVLFRNLACDGQCRVVEFLKHIFVGNRIIVNLLTQIGAERFHARKDDLPVIGEDGHPFDEVIYTIRMRLIV